MSDPAPFYRDVADGPPDGHAVWARTGDGVRIRLGLWPEGGRGTVLLFPGRTEYIEKYGRAAEDLRARGYATVAIDWRGQGLADRALDDPNTGHVMRFRDYQMDVAAMLDAARAAGLPEPWYLIGHSMGGAIGLRALHEGLPVRAAVFSAPMWGLALSSTLRPVAWSLSWLARRVGYGHAYAPGTKPVTYVVEAAFDGNLLTTDPEMYAYMQRQLSEHPDLSLGGPSLHWVNEALLETRLLEARASPPFPTLAFLGSNERIVDPAAVEARMARWPDGALRMLEGAEHEVMMERPEVRNAVFDGTAAHFAAHP